MLCKTSQNSTLDRRPTNSLGVDSVLFAFGRMHGVAFYTDQAIPGFGTILGTFILDRLNKSGRCGHVLLPI
ncbi:hypothetical protein [Myxacorys almedinensis]|uniref:Uncharacterized protein n=1 Tax=Myxacorys almedinensis A TaxID=2690445 RepID=A0A8J7Z574_9CYAN|nr:hypothetical protein [Myxacorys almedinensis]NDJ18391.1 hypothetical protein [Myxacorys almedinensis A]